jgi:hypothetical protein
LTKEASHALGHDTRDRIRTTPRRVWHDDCDAARRIDDLRCCNWREGRERHSTGCHTEKTSAFEFHSVPPENLCGTTIPGDCTGREGLSLDGLSPSTYASQLRQSDFGVVEQRTALAAGDRMKALGLARYGKDYEGRGISQALLERACGVLVEARSPRMWLTTWPGTRAEQFYRRAGWRVVGTDDGNLVFERQGPN